MRLTCLCSDVPCGAAGCLRLAKDHLDAAPFLVLESSVLVDFDPAAFLTEHGGRATAVVATVDLDAPLPSWNGYVPFATPAGVYTFAPSVFRCLSKPGYMDIKEQLLGNLAEDGQDVRFVPMDAPHRFVRDVGSLLAANCEMLEGRFPGLFRPEGLREIAPRVWASGPVAIGPNVRLVGPILLGAVVAVASGATLIGPLVIGPKTHIGRNALVRESVLWGDNIVEERARLYRCVMSQTALLPAGSRAEESVITDGSLSPVEARALRQMPYRVSGLPLHPRPEGLPPEPSLGP
jgi:NDP-sugar pyrophosphorylase family protein